LTISPTNSKVVRPIRPTALPNSDRRPIGGSKAPTIARSLRKIADKIISGASLCNKKLNFPNQGYSGIGAIRYAVADMIECNKKIDLIRNSRIICQNSEYSRISAIARRSGSI
jgi:hypothetical protein